MKTKSSLLATAAAVLLSVAPAYAATTYAIDAAHSDVSFRIRHLMSKLRGGFNDFSGTIVRDDADLSKASVEFKIQATSIDTRNESRDDDLRSDSFFDVAKFPEITFTSTAVEKLSDNMYKVTGPFTMHGVTKVITLSVGFEGEVKDARGVLRAGFSLATEIDRKEFGMTWNRTLDSGGYLLSDGVLVEISIEAKEQQPAPVPAQ